MSCVVGIVDRGIVWIGGDTMLSDTGRKFSGTTRKVHLRIEHGNRWVIGIVGLTRYAQILQYNLKFPALDKKAHLERVIFSEIVPQIRELTRDVDLKKEGVPLAGVTCLIGIREQLFRVHGDLFIMRHSDYDGVGVASEALGSLFSTRGKKPRMRILTALKAAAYRNPDCVSKPFNILHT